MGKLDIANLELESENRDPVNLIYDILKEYRTQDILLEACHEVSLS